MLKGIIRFMIPLRTVAKELTTIRELFELYLSEVHGVVRITEDPHKWDTEITYGTKEDEGPKSALRRLMEEE